MLNVSFKNFLFEYLSSYCIITFCILLMWVNIALASSVSVTVLHERRS